MPIFFNKLLRNQNKEQHAVQDTIQSVVPTPPVEAVKPPVTLPKKIIPYACNISHNVIDKKLYRVFKYVACCPECSKVHTLDLNENTFFCCSNHHTIDTTLPAYTLLPYFMEGTLMELHMELHKMELENRNLAKQYIAEFNELYRMWIDNNYTNLDKQLWRYYV